MLLTKQDLRGLATLVLTLLMLMLVAGCATTGASPALKLYEANSNYAVALAAAADYAESPLASPKIVRELNNARKAAQPAVDYTNAFILCRGKASGVVAGINCALYNFQPGTLSSYAAQLRAGAAALLLKGTVQ